MRFICDLSWETKKMLERIYQYSEHHQTRQRAKCLLLSFQGTPIKELMKILKWQERQFIIGLVSGKKIN